MKVVHVVRQFSPAVGGLEEAVLKLCMALRRAGIEVEVVTLDRVFGDAGAALPAVAQVEGIPVRRIPYRGSTRYPLAPAVLRHIGDADLVHVHAIDFFFDFLALTRPIHRKKLIASTHGGFFHTEFAQKLKRVFFNTVTRSSALAYGAICASSENDAATFATIAPGRVVTIENGVDIDKWRDGASRGWQRSMVSIGRFASNKRPELLIPLIRELRALNPEWRLTLVGRPWDIQAEQLTALAQANGVEDAVRIVVSPSDRQILDEIAGASYVVSSSAYEGFGLSAVEGMSAGLVPLLSPIPPFAKLVRESGCGRLVAFEQPQAEALELERWHQDAVGRAGALRAASLSAAAGYGWHGAAMRFAEQYAKIVGTAP
ncbi:MAG TPA: glycosyltransferase family 4 protein [Xanthobacteraceae bacterium]|nr:glycosyltransferase family 4 protein [Xanthobacteraceae bacterium]